MNENNSVSLVVKVTPQMKSRIAEIVELTGSTQQAVCVELLDRGLAVPEETTPGGLLTLDQAIRKTA